MPICRVLCNKYPLTNFSEINDSAKTAIAPMTSCCKFEKYISIPSSNGLKEVSEVIYNLQQKIFFEFSNNFILQQTKILINLFTLKKQSP